MVTEVAKVVDFGISKIRRTGGQMTRDMTLLGTPQFMSPEAALGQNSALDGRADQWSLAVIMYLCLTGRLPFDSENPVGVLYMVVHEKPVPIKQLAPDLPDHIVAAIEKAMSKRKDDRFPRMVDFVKAVLGQTQAAPSRLNLAPAKATDAQPAQAVERPRVQPSPQPARPLPAALPSVGHMPTGPGAVPAKPGPIGGTPTPQFDPPTVPQTTPSLLPAPTKLAVDGTHVYFATYSQDGKGGTIGRVDKHKAGGEPELLTGGHPSLSAMAMDEQAVYFRSNQGLFRIAKSGGEAQQLLARAELRNLARLAVDGTHLYFFLETDSRGKYAVARLAKTGGTPETIGPVANSTAQLALSATHVYFFRRATLMEDGLAKVPKLGGAAETVDASGHSTGYLTVSGGNVYFTDIGAVYRVPS